MKKTKLLITTVMGVTFSCSNCHSAVIITGLKSYITSSLIEVFHQGDTISDFYFVTPSSIIENIPAGNCVQISCTSKTTTTAGGGYNNPAYNVTGCSLVSSNASPGNYSCTRFCTSDQYVASSRSRCMECPDNSYGSMGSAHFSQQCSYCHFAYYFNGSQCVRCATGSFAVDGTQQTIHSNRSCNYCAVGYYWNGTGCQRCPTVDDVPQSQISTPGILLKPDITQCYIIKSTNEYQDDTGVYVISEEGDRNNQCYYTK